MMADAMTRSPTHSPAAMDTAVAEMCDPNPDLDVDSGTMPDKISAYYSLAFPNFTFYLQTLTVTIGRRSVRTGTASSSDVPQADVDLGPLKSVSRLHARIEYEEENGQFVLAVLGRNGVWVDGTWFGSGSRVPLGARSQIQIATRIFHFILPPPPAPEDSPSPSSPSSTTRHLSPSIDITSLSPASSFPSPLPSTAELPAKTLAESTQSSKAISKVNGKKRKKPGSDIPKPLPDIMPPRPQFTYAQLCYRAIRALDGKATLQDICRWVAENFDWYRFNEGSGWENSIRHNLSSNPAFKKMERCAGERGKGFYWSMDNKFEHVFEEQEAKASAIASSASDGKDSPKGKTKGKGQKGGTTLMEPPLKRSVKGDFKSPLPPPLTSTPLPAFTTTPLSTATNSKLPTADVVDVSASASVHVKSETLAPLNDSAVARPPAVSTSPRVTLKDPASASQSSTPNSNAALPALPPDMIVPIVIGPMPSPTTAGSSADPTATPNGTSPHLATPPIALRGDTLILNPTIFAHLTPEQLKELEALGATKAIEILQAHIKRFIKERIKTEGARGKGRGRGKGRTKRSKETEGQGSLTADADDSVNGIEGGNGLNCTPTPPSRSKSKIDKSSGPFTTTPLLPRQPVAQRQQQVSGTHGSAALPSISTPVSTAMPTVPNHPSREELVPTVVDMKPPVPVRVAPSPPPMSHVSLTATSAGEHESDVDGPAMKRRRVEMAQVNG